jgi:hypothetical protein
MKPCPLPPARNLECEQGIAPYLPIKTKEIQHTTICGKGNADSLLGWTRGNVGTLHAQGEHCDQCNVNRSCSQVQTTWMSEYRCFAPTWQCMAPYCLFNCWSVRPVSSTSAYMLDLAPSLWTAQGGDGRQVFQVWYLIKVQQAVHEWLCSQPEEFFSRDINALLKPWNSCVECNGNYIEKWSHCVHFVLGELRGKKHLMFSFDSPSYIYEWEFILVLIFVLSWLCGLLIA